jgi:hypothetical protein
LGIAVSCIFSMWPSHGIRWLLINLTIFSPLILSSDSSFRRIIYNSFSFTGPYIFRRIFLSNTANNPKEIKTDNICWSYISYCTFSMDNKPVVYKPAIKLVSEIESISRWIAGRWLSQEWILGTN